ncbi:MAG: nucleotidyl transferase AbiEii/AbiGii toxin family protein [Methanophagales archaeon]|nr:nucleotidyl transferase AbiEii/AbiGii toxin family protein [Methanophagales archaeon]
MLKMEYLLEEAKELGLPQTKKRAILRQYLQTIILNSIYKSNFARSMFFVGGTALRFFYNLPRFSEDLDFDTPSLENNGFKKILERVEMNLSLEGFSARISYKKRDNLFIASINFPAVMSDYGIINGRGGDIMIKIEVNKPEWHLSTESHVLSLYGYNFSAILMSKGALLSEKISALLSRKRGRYIYDVLFMLRKKFPFDREVLYANNIKEEPKNLILNYLSGISEKELKRLAEQVKPFLFREDDIELVLKAPQYGEKFLSKY